MKIIQITLKVGEDKTIVFGLGDDNNIYLWNSNTTKWVLFKVEDTQ